MAHALFLDRMVAALGAAQDAGQVPTGGSGDSVRALINVIKKEEITINIDLGDRIPVALPHLQPWCGRLHAPPYVLYLQGIMLGNLPTTCYPPSEATNKLASLRAKAIKAKVCSCLHICNRNY